MDPATDKYHITGVGCASGVPLMRLAASGAARAPAQAGAGRRGREHERHPDARPPPTTRRPRSSARRSSATAARPRCCRPTPAPTGPAILASQVHQIARHARRRQPAAAATTTATCTSRASCPTSPAPGWASVVDGFLRHNRLQRADDRPLDRAPRRPADHRERAVGAGALRRGRRDELARAGRARQRRHAVDLLRARGHDRAATSRSPASAG